MSPKPVVQIPMVHPNAKTLLDQRCDADGGPAVGGKTECAGAAVQPREDLFDLFVVELRWSAPTGPGRQSCFPVAVEVVAPATNASRPDADEVRDILLAPSIGKPEHRQQSNLLQHNRRPWQREHGWHYRGCSEKRTRFF